MGFTLTSKRVDEDAPNERATYRSITGARIAASNEVKSRASELLADDAAFCERMTPQARRWVGELLDASVQLLDFNGPMDYAGHDVEVSIAQVDEPASTNASGESVTNGARWMDKSRFFARCATCDCAIPQGSRAWYDPRMPRGKKMKCEAHGGA